jgi:hypothetical protein
MPQVVAVGVNRFSLAAYVPICWTSANPDEVAYPARSSIAPDNAVPSATDWFCRFIAYQSPVSTPRPVNPISAEMAAATRARVAPRVSLASRCAIAQKTDPSLVVISGLRAGKLVLFIGPMVFWGMIQIKWAINERVLESPTY